MEGEIITLRKKFFPPHSLVLVSTNAGKLADFNRLLGWKVVGVKQELVEPQSLSLEEVVKAKAVQAFSLLNRPLLVEDTSFGFQAWKGLPGPFIRSFGQALGFEELSRLILATGEVSAEAFSSMAYHDGWRVWTSRAKLEGRVVKPRGAGGFGWDSVMEVEGKTLAEMTLEEKEKISMRTRAFLNLLQNLEKNAIPKE